MASLGPEVVPVSYTCEIPGSSAPIRIRLRVIAGIRYRLEQLLRPNPGTAYGILTGVRTHSGITDITGFQPLPTLDSATVGETVSKAQAVDLVGFYRSTAPGQLHISDEDIRVAQTLVNCVIILLIETDQCGVGDAALVVGNQLVSRFPFDAQQLAAPERQPAQPTMLARRAWRPPGTVVLAAIAILAGAGSYFLSAERHRVATGSLAPVRQAPPPVTQLPAKSSLALRVEPRGPALLLTWNTQSAPIANASLGMITIWSGGAIRNLTLTPEQLRSGSIMYKPVSDQVEFQLAVMSGDQVTQESVIALLPERSSELSSSGERARSAEPTAHVERPALRTFSPPAPLESAVSSLPANLDQPPLVLESSAKQSEVASFLGSPPPPPATATGEMTIQTYTGIVVDAACACAVSPATALFALRLQDGRILPFDSIGNDRVRKKKNKWVAPPSAGKPVQAKVSGAVLGDKLLVLSIN